MFLCLDQNATKLAKLGLDTSKRLTDMVGTLWILRVLKPTDRELRRADRVLGPATIICSSPSQITKKTGLRTISE